MNHAPTGYVCPFCRIVAGDSVVNGHSVDMLLKDDDVTAFISLHQWPANKGHVLIVPNLHYENLYELPERYGAAIHRAARTMAFALKQAFNCAGISTRQHNEPAGNQDVWHYHLHVLPRFPDDNLYGCLPSLISTEERAEQARRIREALETLDEQ
ncbi:MAG: HIT domain-containing protein [Gammaproteobacteria bacterium]|nr:HIT domain-containing protein [Gammaproteobacteria bacterium]